MAHEIGTFTLEPFRQLLDCGEEVPIGGRALHVLSILAEAGGRLVTKDELIREVWNGAVIEDNAIQAQVSLARRALGTEARRLIAVHGRGYRLDIAAPDGAARIPKASVAVLPFVNLTGDAAREYLADAMAEEVIHTLSRASQIKVPARTSSFAYKGRDTDVRQIASELGVSSVLEGSIRAVGDRIRITAQLIEASTGFHLWGRNYDREFGDLFALQDEIAESIAAALKVQFGLEEVREPDFEAYHLFLQARSLLHVQNPGNIMLARALLDQAIAREPKHARFHAMRAFCTHMAIVYGVAEPELRSEIKADTEVALALDPELSWIYELKSVLLSSTADWCGADVAVQARAAKEGMGRAGADPEGINSFGMLVCAPLGHLDRALACCRRSREIAPAVPITSALIATILSLKGEYDEAEEALNVAYSLGFPRSTPPAVMVAAQLAAERSDFGEAARAINAFFLASPHFAALTPGKAVDAVYGALDGLTDRQSASDLVSDLFQAVIAGRNMAQFNSIFPLLLDWQTRLGFLDRAYDIADAQVAYLQEHAYISPVTIIPVWNPWMRPFRDDVRFERYATALNMFPYWLEHGPPDGYHFDGQRLVPLNAA